MESIRDIEEFSERVSDEYFLNDSYFGNILTCLTEAVSNAIVHGNKLDETKTVFVLLEEKDEGLLFTVIDQGEGYDLKQFNGDITSDVEGRGIMLIRSLADETIIQNKGRVISMLFRINGIDQKVAEKRAQLLLEYEKAVGKLARKHLE